ncbi:hypothetical protein FHQ28_05530 [Pasteurellaceae bacterium USgator11]|nr:hypothetical protein FHQ20_07790 [Pasteurellaceae bacterium USgator41]TNG96458.1 hypothetical protein FHQ19_01965 [Pasteurellaceae bacterium UScroc12]TNH00460.1 hypothetical protein FHQ24_03660 [Pasteurellaceae bacterium UScroc31]TNH01709.1 hypothetical protein FHQ28_05530 [Pasteurellaceae bacterium USgator11]
MTNKKCPKCGGEVWDLCIGDDWGYYAGEEKHYECKGGEPTGEYYAPIKQPNGNILIIAKRTKSCGEFTFEEVSK